MAKTTLTHAQATDAVAKLERAMRVFNDAIAAFHVNCEPATVGLQEWIDSNEDTMGDIAADIVAHFE